MGLMTVLLRGVQVIRTTILWAVEILLAVVWISTLQAHAAAGSSSPMVGAVIVVFLLFILYFAEGLELAFADLRDKDPEQIDRAIMPPLREMQIDPGFFLGQRQVFVVVIISLMTLLTSYPWIAVPWSPRHLAAPWPFWFSLLFTSLTVLWFCQVTPKRLAVINSEQFLRHSRWLWPIIKALGRALDLPRPADQLVWIARRKLGYDRARLLLPSRAMHYSTSARINGFCLDRLDTQIVIGRDGTARTRKRYLALFLHGRRDQIDGWMATDSAFVRKPEVRLLGLYAASVPERVDGIASDLDEIFRNKHPGNTAFGDNLVNQWAATVRGEMTPSQHRKGEEASWHIKSPVRLPEDFQSHMAGTAVMMVLTYEVEAQSSTGAYETSGRDDFVENLESGCRRYSLSVTTEPTAGFRIVRPDLDVTFGDLRTPLPEETDRCRPRITNGGNPPGILLEVDYPIRAVYRVRWEVFPEEL
jgi:hypothetical protein